ncbi:MAG: hypothetical protein GY722_14250 [bacterium]|nr:hypothetical protein [bacterium]
MLKPVLLYLDPGTGATLAQIALAGTAGIAAAAKLRMNKLRRKSAVPAKDAEMKAETEEATEEPASAE